MKPTPREQNVADHLTKGKSWCEMDEFIRRVGGQMTVSISNKGNEHSWKKWQERQPRTRRDVRGS